MDIKEKEALLCSKYDRINRLLAIQNIRLPDREDLLHEIFVKAFRSLDRLREVDKMDSWLWKITKNEVNRYLGRVITRRQRIRTLSTEEEVIYAETTNPEQYLLLTDEQERICDRDELIQALKMLPEKILVVFRLYYFEGYNLNEIAQILDESYNTVKSRHRRGLEKLREILQKGRQE